MSHVLQRLGFLFITGLGVLGHPPAWASDPLLAPPDPSCEFLNTTVAPAYRWVNQERPLYFSQSIERHIHQIWFGDPGRMDAYKVNRWREMAQAFGYSHMLWNEGQLPLLASIMPEETFALLQHVLQMPDYRGASDILRLFLLEFFGGIYSDVDITAPSYEGQLVDIGAVVPLQNLVIMSEHHGRDVGNNVAMFAANGLIMASAHHPVIQHLLQTLPDNVQSFREKSTGLPFDAMYATGPFFVNRSISGPITVLPITYLEALGMVD